MKRILTIIRKDTTQIITAVVFLAILVNRGYEDVYLASIYLLSPVLLAEIDADKKTDWNRYEVCLPVSKLEIVLSKFITYTILTFVLSVEFYIMLLIKNWNNKISSIHFLISSFNMLFSGILILAITIYMGYRFSIQNSKSFIILMIVIISIALTILNDLLGHGYQYKMFSLYIINTIITFLFLNNAKKYVACS